MIMSAPSYDILNLFIVGIVYLTPFWGMLINSFPPGMGRDIISIFILQRILESYYSAECAQFKSEVTCTVSSKA